MGSLGQEKERWIKSSERLLKEKQSIVGDSIIAAAFITYLGAFSAQFREKIVRHEWRILIHQEGIPVGEDFVLHSLVSSQ
jgi:hypothetical protein